MAIENGEVLYAAYGDMERILPVLLDRRLESGISVVMHDVQLCIQDIAEVPDAVAPDAPAPVSPRQILTDTWGDEFSAYAVRPVRGAQTPARLHVVTEGELELIEDYNLHAFGWFHALAVGATAVDVRRQPGVDPITDAIESTQSATPIETRGRIQQPPLNGERALEVAETVRKEFLARAA